MSLASRRIKLDSGKKNMSTPRKLLELSQNPIVTLKLHRNLQNINLRNQVVRRESNQIRLLRRWLAPQRTDFGGGALFGWVSRRDTLGLSKGLGWRTWSLIRGFSVWIWLVFDFEASSSIMLANWGSRSMKRQLSLGVIICGSDSITLIEAAVHMLIKKLIRAGCSKTSALECQFWGSTNFWARRGFGQVEIQKGYKLSGFWGILVVLQNLMHYAWLTQPVLSP